MMFKFLFEGKIGEMLAPVTGFSNQLFLAIQHHRNEEFNSLIASSSYDLSSCAECGYACIHVACRYNNRYVLDLLLVKGIPSLLD